MKIKKRIGALLFLALLTACSQNTEKGRTEPDLPVDPSQVTEAESGEPENNDELFDLIMEEWTTGDTEALRPYLSDEILSLCDSDIFLHMFESITNTFGEIVTINEPQITSAGGFDVYSAAVHLEHADVDITLSLKDTKICGFVRDIRFNGEFDVTRAGIREHYFRLNGLNAVYTCAENSESTPAVLMISGSGPCDYNATVGILSPMEDLALGLAECGISSLRFEKRTMTIIVIATRANGSTTAMTAWISRSLRAVTPPLNHRWSKRDRRASLTLNRRSFPWYTHYPLDSAGDDYQTNIRGLRGYLALKLLRALSPI